MSNKDFIEKDGVVVETLPNEQYKIKLEDTSEEVIGYRSGKMRKFNVHILLGDRVKLEFSKYDNKTGRITYRYK